MPKILGRRDRVLSYYESSPGRNEHRSQYGDHHELLYDHARHLQTGMFYYLAVALTVKANSFRFFSSKMSFRFTVEDNNNWLS